MGEDDFEHEDRAVVTTKWGPAVMPASVKNLRGEALETFVELQQTQVEIQRLEEAVWTAGVPLARELGLSWSVIGAALGMTGVGAAKRYSRESGLTDDA